MAKSRFGADKYKPHQLGPEPAAPAASSEPEPTTPAAPEPEHRPTVRKAAPIDRAAPDAEKLREIRVQFSSRISYAADQQLKELAKQGPRQTELLAEALNLLFKKHGLDEVA